MRLLLFFYFLTSQSCDSGWCGDTGTAKYYDVEVSSFCDIPWLPCDIPHNNTFLETFKSDIPQNPSHITKKKMTTGKKIWHMNCMRADKKNQINLNKDHIQRKVYTDVVEDILRLCKWLK